MTCYLLRLGWYQTTTEVYVLSSDMLTNKNNFLCILIGSHKLFDMILVAGYNQAVIISTTSQRGVERCCIIVATAQTNF